MMSLVVNNTKNDEWLTIKEVIQYSKLSEATIRRYIQRGNLKVSKQTGRILIKRSKVDEWLNG
jgi:excisionase family DNA binding protein